MHHVKAKRPYSWPLSLLRLYGAQLRHTRTYIKVRHQPAGGKLWCTPCCCLLHLLSPSDILQPERRRIGVLDCQQAVWHAVQNGVMPTDGLLQALYVRVTCK